MNKRIRAWLGLSGLTVATLALAVGTANVFTVGLFELDENAQNGAAAGDDADQIYCDQVDILRLTAACQNVAPSSANKLVSVFSVGEKFNDAGDDAFAGNSKDILDVTAWTWGTGTNDKTDIEHAFAALYVDPATGDNILYFGLDKLQNNGDAAIGFWFLQNDTQLVPGGTFTPGHKVGDVLVQADLTNGGRIGRFDVFTWGDTGIGGTQFSNTDLYLVFDSTNCGDPGYDFRSCGVVNTTDVPAPWPFTYKGPGGAAPSTVFPAPSYFEAGLNLSALFPAGVPCISSMIAETRQSQSEPATLGDLVLMQFDLCSIDVVKSGPSIAKVGDTITYDVVITNDGALTVTKNSIEDSLAGDITNLGNCGATLAPGASCSIQYTYLVAANGPDPRINTVTANYSVGASGVADTSNSAAELFTPAITLNKTANDQKSVTIDQGQSVTYKIVLTNTSSADAPDLVCSLTDPQVEINPGDPDPHTISGIQLAPQGTTTVTVSSGILTAVGTTTNTVSASCQPVDFPNTLTATSSASVTVRLVPAEIAVDKTGPTNSKVGDSVTFTITIQNLRADRSVELTSIVDTLLGNLTDGTNASITSNTCVANPGPGATGVLAPLASCVITVARTTQAGDPDPLLNTVTVTGTNVFGNASTKSDNHSVNLFAPNFSVSKSCLTQPVLEGQSANFRIQVKNTSVNGGKVDLLVDVTDALLGLNDVDQLLGTTSNTCPSEGTPGNGCYEVEVGIVATGSSVNNTVNVHATIPENLGDFSNVIADKTAQASCTVTPRGGATRTLGFWKSHGSDGDRFDPPLPAKGYTCHVAESHGGFPISLGWKTMLNCEDIFGVFWSSPSKTSTGANRPQLCKTKQHASWQLLAAILNSRLTNGASVPIDPVTGLNLITALQTALTTNDAKEITRLAAKLDAYNNSGDGVAIIDADGTLIPPADPNGTRFIADYTAGDCQ